MAIIKNFQNESVRLKGWDYSNEGAYFITVCTKERNHFFGKVENKKMKLSSIGVIADICWHEIKNHSSNVKLGGFIVMPDHIHGILILKDLDNFQPVLVGTLHATSLQEPERELLPNNEKYQFHPEKFSRMSPKSGSISTIVRSYKSAVTKHAHRLGFEFSWQPKFYDHIIKDEKELKKVTEYILNNPSAWIDV